MAGGDQEGKEEWKRREMGRESCAYNELLIRF